MKKTVLYLTTILTIAFSACEKESTEEPSGNNGDENPNSELVIDPWSFIEYDNNIAPTTYSNISGNHYQWIDVNGDNKKDLVYADFTRIMVQYMGSEGQLGTIAELLDLDNYGMSGDPYGISSFSFADEEGDGDLDIYMRFSSWPWAGASFLTEEIAFALNEGNFNFPNGIMLTINQTDDYPEEYEFGPFGDYSGDGKPDVCLVWKNDQNSSIYWSIHWGTGSMIFLQGGTGTGQSGHISHELEYYIATSERIGGQAHFLNYGPRVKYSGAEQMSVHTYGTNAWGYEDYTNAGFSNELLMEYNEYAQSATVTSIGGKNSLFTIGNWEYQDNSHSDYPGAKVGIKSFFDILSYSELPIGRIPNYRLIDFPNGAYSCAAIDFDGNGIDELAVATPTGSSTFRIDIYSIEESQESTSLTYLKTIQEDVPYDYSNINSTLMTIDDLDGDGNEDIHLEFQGKYLINNR